MWGQVSLAVVGGCCIHGCCRKQLAPIADQGHFHLYRGSAGFGRGKAKRAEATSQIIWPSIEAPGLPFSHLVKRRLGLVLVSLEPGHDLPSCELLLYQEFRRHLIPVDDDPLHPQLIDRLRVAAEQVRQSNRQGLLPSVRGRQQWMSLRIVQQHQFATAQDFPGSLGVAGVTTPAIA
jgi:hypothetical protein